MENRIWIRAVAMILVCAIVAEPVLAGVGSHSSMYVGGTAPEIKTGEAGVLTDETTLVSFKPEKGTPSWKVPYDKVSSLSYGQHAGRRVGATIALGVTTLGIGALPVLFSKKRRHYLTIEYADADGKQQAAIFEVGKDAVRALLKTLEVRTGKKVEYEDDEARKAGNK